MNGKETDLRSIWTEFENGTPLTRIARRHKIGRKALSSRLQRNNEVKYRKIMSTSRTAKKNVDLQGVWAELVRGTALRRIAQKQKISDATLAKKLQQDNKMKYDKIMKTRRTKRRSVDLRTVWAELECGTITLKRIAEKRGISRPGLAKKLRRNNEPKYRKIMRISKINREIFRGYFGSPEARRQGADSLFELGVKRLLEKNKIRFRFHPTLRLGKYRYIPDFLLFDDLILEAAGFFTNGYWRYCREKAKNYSKAGYIVFFVVLDHVSKKAEKYLRNQVRVIKYSDFKKDPRKTLGISTIDYSSRFSPEKALNMELIT